MPSYDHTELLALVRELSETNDENHLRWCIQECHNGVLHGPIDQKNLHLFRTAPTSRRPTSPAPSSRGPTSPSPTSRGPTSPAPTSRGPT